MVGDANQQSNKSLVPSWTLVLALLGLSFVCLSILIPILSSAKLPSPKQVSIRNLEQLALAHEVYMGDFDGLGPSPATWADQLMPYIKNAPLFKSPHFIRPNEVRMEDYGYAYYRPLSGLSLDKVQNPDEVPLVFDSSDMRWNANGDLSLLPDPPRWDGKNLIAFLDGHVKAVEGTPKVEINIPTE